MSLRSLSDTAVERDVRTPRRLAARGVRAPDALNQPQDKQWRDALVDAIPTEILAPYTALTAAIIATIDPDEPSRLTMRWIIYGVGIVSIVAFLGASYARRRKPGARKFPWAESLAAVLAFAAWGLVMPGSPLLEQLTGDDRVIWIAIITIGGAVLVGLISGRISRPAPTAQEEPDEPPPGGGPPPPPPGQP